MTRPYVRRKRGNLESVSGYPTPVTRLGAKVIVKADNERIQEREGDQWRRVGERIAKGLPSDWTVEVTGGPYRGYDINGEVDKAKKTVYIDIYSVAPITWSYVDELAHNAEAMVVQELALMSSICPRCKGSGIDREKGGGRFGIECQMCQGAGRIYREKKLR